MKRLISLIAGILITVIVAAQTPQKMSYQAVIRNSSNQLATSQNIGIRISILQGSPSGTVVYTETQTPISNSNGLISIEIGNGTGFNSINWANNSYFLKTETDPTGGSNYTITGVSQLLSVPYALYSEIADSISGGIVETDPVWSSASSNYYTTTNLQTVGTSQIHFGNLTNNPTTILGYGITDAMSTSHPSFAITNTNINNWNTAYGWGNHANAGYLTTYTENDPIWSGVSMNYYTISNMQTGGSAQLHFNNITNKPSTLAGYGITNAIPTTHAVNGITATNINNWNTAFTWGNHAIAGYLTSFTESDPLWTSASINYYTKVNMQSSGQADLHFNNISNKPTTLAGYGITNALTLIGGTLTGSLVGSGATTTLSGFNAALTSSSSSTYILSISDNGKIITIDNVSSITVTVPTGLPSGFNCMFVQKGDGQITFSALGTVLNNRSNYTKTAGKYAIATVVHLGSNVFITSGDMQ